jgi:hypothetical protein
MAFIVRLDKPKNSIHGTHGWQVRSRGRRGYHSRLFTDNVHGGKAKALEAAEEYLEQYHQAHPEELENPHQPYHKGELLGSNQSGVTGVYYTEYPHRWDKERMEAYWCAFVPMTPDLENGRFSKAFRVGRFGDEEARQLAVEFRREWEKAVNTNDKRKLQHFFEEYHFKRLIDTRFGSEDREAMGLDSGGFLDSAGID